MPALLSRGLLRLARSSRVRAVVFPVLRRLPWLGTRAAAWVSALRARSELDQALPQVEVDPRLRPLPESARQVLADLEHACNPGE